MLLQVDWGEFLELHTFIMRWYCSWKSYSFPFFFSSLSFCSILFYSILFLYYFILFYCSIPFYSLICFRFYSILLCSIPRVRVSVCFPPCWNAQCLPMGANLFSWCAQSWHACSSLQPWASNRECLRALPEESVLGDRLSMEATISNQVLTSAEIPPGAVFLGRVFSKIFRCFARKSGLEGILSLFPPCRLVLLGGFEADGGMVQIPPSQDIHPQHQCSPV